MELGTRRQQSKPMHAMAAVAILVSSCERVDARTL